MQIQGTAILDNTFPPNKASCVVPGTSIYLSPHHHFSILPVLVLST